MGRVDSLDLLRARAHWLTADLLAVPTGDITEDGLRMNIDVGIQYLESWLMGNGCVPLYNLMEDAAIGETPYPFHGDGDSVVDKPHFDAGRIWINATQYFDNVPAVAWGFLIGGYQPTQKWLKDRKGRTLGWDDIRHYQKIVKILTETDRIMGEIELPLTGQTA